MKSGEKRKHARLESLNLLDYIVVDSHGTTGRYAMGRTLDISEDGIKLETTQPLYIGDTLILTIELEGDLVDLHGEVTNCRPESGRYINGIKFTEISAGGRKLIKRYSDTLAESDQMGENS